MTDATTSIDVQITADVDFIAPVLVACNRGTTAQTLIDDVANVHYSRTKPCVTQACAQCVHQEVREGTT